MKYVSLTNASFADAKVQRGVNLKLIKINICNTHEVTAHEMYKLYDDNRVVKVNSKTSINIDLHSFEIL